jgi:CRP-like cAMP-binding protein
MTSLRPSIPARAAEPLDLSRFRLFDGLSHGDRDALGSWLVRVELEAGDTLIEEGTVGRELYLVDAGDLVVMHGPTGQSIIVNRIGPGQDVGFMAMFEGARRTATVRAAAPSVVYRLHYDDLVQIFGDTTDAPFARILGNQLRSHGEFLVRGNAAALASSQRETDEARRRLRFGSFVAVLIGSVTLYAVVLRIALALTAEHVDSTFITIGILVACVAIYVPMMIKSGYPLSTYGLTLRGWRRATVESLVWTAAFLVVVTVLKAIGLALVPSWHDQPLFSFYGFTRYASLAQALGLMALYSFFAPVQELIARGAMQSSLHEFLSGKHANVWAILLSTLMFSQIHLHLTPWYALAVFFPSLFWGAMYARQRTLVGVSLSHVLIGIYVAFFLGLPMMTHR